MAQFTQKAIIETFHEMLETTPFDKITVSSIVAKCEISSNTFYYHFRDIYDLFDAWLKREMDTVLSPFSPDDPWENAIKAILHYIKDHKSIIDHVSTSLSRERLERYIFDAAGESIHLLVCKEAEGQTVSEECLQDVSDFCRFALLGFFLKFIWNDMHIDIDESVDRLSVLFVGFVRNAFHEYASGMKI